jgi:hypothetical protein
LLIAGKVARSLLRKHFDGLFLDNTDMIETHPRRARGMRVLVAPLARLVHARGDVLFTQNGEDSIGPTLRFYDGWNREDVTSTFTQPPGTRPRRLAPSTTRARPARCHSSATSI